MLLNATTVAMVDKDNVATGWAIGYNGDISNGRIGEDGKRVRIGPWTLANRLIRTAKGDVI
jgi:hypothetical protein